MIQFSSVDYTGVLVLNDPVLFLQRLAQGTVKSRAFGCGAMIKPGDDADVACTPPDPVKESNLDDLRLQYGQIDVLDGRRAGRTVVTAHCPVGSVACIMLEPGTRVYAAVRASRSACW